LLLDEVCGLTYDKAVDEVNGFEDFGSGVCTEKYANQALGSAVTVEATTGRFPGL